MRPCLWLILALNLIGLSHAHAYLTTADPKPGAVLQELPLSITLTMNEAVELKFSQFKIYPLDIDPADKKALVEAAKALLDEKIKLRNDEAERADIGLLSTEGRSATISIGLKQDLAPGLYIVMWKVLSVDTHTGEDFSYFIYAPQAP